MHSNQSDKRERERERRFDLKLHSAFLRSLMCERSRGPADPGLHEGLNLDSGDLIPILLQFK